MQSETKNCQNCPDFLIKRKSRIPDADFKEIVHRDKTYGV